jgi:hypothetical protein
MEKLQIIAEHASSKSRRDDTLLTVGFIRLSPEWDNVSRNPHNISMSRQM